MRTLVAPFIAAEGLPDAHGLRGSVGGDVDAVGREEVVAGVDLEQVAGFREGVEDEGVVAAERGREFCAGGADEDCVR